MFFSYSSSSITLIDIVLLEQRRRNRGSRVRGEKGGGGGGAEQEKERKVEEEGGKSRKRGLWTENSGCGGTGWRDSTVKSKGQELMGQACLPQDGHRAQDAPAACRGHPPWHGHHTAWASLPQRCPGKTHPFPKPCGTEEPLAAGTPCRGTGTGDLEPLEG